MKRILLALAILPALTLSACAIGPVPAPAASLALSVAATAAETAMQIDAADLARNLDDAAIPAGDPARARLRELDLKVLALGTARATIDLRFASRGLSVPDTVTASRDDTDAAIEDCRRRLLPLAGL